MKLVKCKLAKQCASVLLTQAHPTMFYVNTVQQKTFKGENFCELVKRRFCGENFCRLLAFATSKDATTQNFVEKTFANSYKTAKFTKVFSLEVFRYMVGNVYLHKTHTINVTELLAAVHYGLLTTLRVDKQPCRRSVCVPTIQMWFLQFQFDTTIWYINRVRAMYQL